MFATPTRLVIDVVQFVARRSLSFIRRGSASVRSSDSRKKVIGLAAQSLEQRVLLAADFGDAPDISGGTASGDYSTLASNNGPSHTIDTTERTLFLGGGVDGDTGTVQDADGTGDDTTDALPDDEDGVANLVDLRATVGSDPTVTLVATNSTGSDATITGWIDFNADGVFDNATEQATAMVPTGSLGTHVTLTFPTVPSDFVGETFARFRFSTDAAAGNPEGLASDGEVEDHAFTISLPTDGEVISDQKISNGLGGFVAGSLASGDRFGSSITAIGDLDGDGVIDMAAGAPGTGSGAGAVHVLFMNDDGTVRGSQRIASGVGGLLPGSFTSGDAFGSSIASLGDLDGDGVTDIVVGALGDEVSGNGAEGTISVLFLNADGTVKNQRKIGNGLGGIAEGTLLSDDGFGGAVTVLGDVNGDGITDLAVGAALDDTTGDGEGAVYVLFMDASGAAVQSSKIIDGQTGFAVGSLDAGDAFGSSVAGIGDIDGDGIPDVAVGAASDENLDDAEGAVYVLQLNADGSVKLQSKITDGLGGLADGTLNAGDQFGSSVAGAGDLNGDAVPDLIVGASQAGTPNVNEGAAYILLMSANGSVQQQVEISNTSGGFLDLSAGTTDGFGSAVTVLGDINGDNVVDLAIGASQDENIGVSEGAVYVLGLEGSTTATITGVKFNDINVNGIRDGSFVSGSNPVVQLVFDMSGSTGSPFSGTPVGNINGDFASDTILDAELAGLIALNNQLIQQGLGQTARVALTPFASSSVSLDMDLVTPGIQLSTFPAADMDGNGVPDVEDILRGIDSFTNDIGGGTSFLNALQTAVTTFDNLGTGPNNGNLVFLSDGFGGSAIANEVADLATRGINSSAIGVGAFSSLQSLQIIDPDAVQVTSTDELLALFTIQNGGSNSGFAEPGLGGVTIYLDINQNGFLDAGERTVVSSFDDPDTPNIDETGFYSFHNVLPGTYVVREVVPDGFEQTAPVDATATSLQTYVVDDMGVLALVEVVSGLIQPIGDTGLTLTDLAFDSDGFLYGITETDLYQIDARTAAATLIGPHNVPRASSLVFDDDGTLYAAGVETNLYSIDPVTAASTVVGDIGLISAGDLSFVGNQLYMSTVGNELVEITLQPTFAANVVGNFTEGGASAFAGGLVFGLATGIDDGLYAVSGTSLYSIDPATAEVTFISDYMGQGLSDGNGAAFFSEAGASGANFIVNIAGAETAAGLVFGNAPLPNSSMSGVVYNDVNGNGRREATEPGFAGLRVFLDGNDNGNVDPGELSMETAFDDPLTPNVDESGTYFFPNVRAGSYILRQLSIDGLSPTEPSTGVHRVELGGNEDRDDLDFGNNVITPDVSVVPLSQTVSENVAQPTFAIELSEPSVRDVVIPFALSGTAALGADYHVSTSPIVIPAGETSVDVIVNTVDDLEDEPDETVVFTLLDSDQANVTEANEHTLTIADDDEPASLPLITIGSPDVSIEEGNTSVTVDVRMSFRSNFEITVPFLLSGSADFSDDYNVRQAEVVLPPGVTLGTIVLNIVDDGINEQDETVQITLGEPNNSSLGADVTHVTTILDNDFPPLVNVISARVDNRMADPSDLGGTQPTSWNQQRSEVRGILLQFDGKIRRASASDLVLTNLGVDADQDADVVVSLTDDQLSLENNGQDLFIELPEDGLDEGVYQIEVSSFISGAAPIVVTGDASNRLFALKADYNGSGGVNVQDFATFAYWFRTSTAPSYVDLNRSGGVNIQDFAGYSTNFSSAVVFPGGSAIPVASSGEGELTRAMNTLVRSTDTNGDGTLSPSDALKVINRAASPQPFSVENDWVDDVNRDGRVSPIDVLMVINELAEEASRPMVSDRLPAARSGAGIRVATDVDRVVPIAETNSGLVGDTNAAGGAGGPIANDRWFAERSGSEPAELEADLLDATIEPLLKDL